MQSKLESLTSIQFKILFGSNSLTIFEISPNNQNDGDTIEIGNKSINTCDISHTYEMNTESQISDYL